MDTDEGRDEHRPLSVVLRDLCDEPQITIGEIVERFGRRAFGALLFVFSAPNLLPLPPGSSTALGLPLVLLSPQVALGVHAPWLPRFVDDREIAGHDLARFFRPLLKAVEQIERVSRPRMAFMFGRVGDRLIGLVCTLLALVLILPIPFGNMLPALSVGVLAFSLIQRDGFLALIGYGLAGISAGVLMFAADVVIDAVRHLVNWFEAA
jgi:hypothetical protein